MEKQLLEIGENEVTLSGKPFYIASGDMHYFRVFKSGWARRLKLMRDFGLTCVQTYVPWNLHEPEKGQYDFSGNLDLAEFIKLCGEYDLKVLLRPSVYLCGEWDFGGLPYWLLKDKNINIRCSEEPYMTHVEEYTRRLCKEFVPLLSTNGGPIIAVAVENEYGSFSNDTNYLRKTMEILKSEGVDVPLFSASGPELKHLKWGSLPELWSGIDTREGTKEAKENLDIFNGGVKKPYIVSEQWAGCAQQWGGVFNRQSTEEACSHYKTSLENGYYVNFYMFCGATNFGFMNGALEGKYRADVPGAKDRYIPYLTSYDVDAPVNEYGQPTEKYYALKKILCEHLGKPYEENVCEHKLNAFGTVKLEKSAPLFENLENVADKCVFSPALKTMEELSQDYGFILYSTVLDYTDDNQRRLVIDGLGDRATVYGNGKYLGTIYRDREDDIRFKIPKDGLKLQILVENMGRICYGYEMCTDRKGIKKAVHLDRIDSNGNMMHDYSMLMNWQIHTLSLKNLSKLQFGGKTEKDIPAFYSGNFKAQSGKDTLVDMSQWTKGNVWINGFNIGRYWNIGPQQTLYIPGELLKEENTIQIFELYNAPQSLSVELTDKPELDSISANIDALLQAERA